MSDLTLRYQSSAADVKCQWCGFQHIDGGTCPRVKALEYYADGTVKRVEFHEPAPVNLGWLSTHLTGFPTPPTVVEVE